MSQISYDKFCGLVGKLAEGRDNSDIVAFIRQNHAEHLSSVTTYIVDNAITNIVRNLRRRSAKLAVAGAVDLFAGHSVPAITVKDSIDPQGRRRKVNVRTEHLTKAELRTKIEEIRSKPPRKNKSLYDYEALLLKIQNHCSDDETIEVGLKRANGL